MVHYEALEGVRGKFLFTELQIFQGHLGPRRPFMATRRSQGAEDPLGEFSGILAIPVAAKNHHQFFAVDSRHEGPVDLAHMVEKIGNNDKDIGTSHPAQMDVIASFGIFQIGQGGGEIS